MTLLLFYFSPQELNGYELGEPAFPQLRAVAEAGDLSEVTVRGAYARASTLGQIGYLVIFVPMTQAAVAVH